MKKNNLQFRMLWLGAFISNACFTLIIPFIPLHLFNLGLRENIELWSSAIVIGSYIGASVASPIWGSFSDRFGYKVMIIRAGFANGIIYILCAVAQGPIQLMILRILYGLNSGFMPATNALVTEISSKEEIAKRLGSLQTAVIGGQLMGPLLGGILGSFFSIKVAFLIAGFAMISNTFLLLFFIQNNKKVETKNITKRTSILQDIKSSFEYNGIPQLLLIGFLFQVSAGMLFPVLGTYLMDMKLEQFLSNAISYFINDNPYSLLTGLVFSVPGIVAFFSIKKWSERGAKVGFVSNIKLGLFFGLTLSYITFFISSITFLLIIRAIQGFFTANIIPGISTLIAQRVSSNYKGTAFSLLNSVRSLGSIVGPLLGGTIVFLLGEKWVFIGIGFVLSLSFYFVLKNKNLSEYHNNSKEEAI